jgi:lipopolysaccharide assembly outer membrane protein LptD (OstA)
MVHVSIRTAALAALLVATVAAAPGGVTTRDFRIETDQTNSNLNDGSFTMPHRVKLFRPGTDVVGDSAKGNYKAGTVTITGHVVMHDTGQSSGSQAGGSAPEGGPASLQCDELQVDSKRKIYVAAGNVVYTQGARRATARNGRLDQGARTLDLSGDVRLADGDQTLSAQTVHYNTQTKDVSTSGNPVILTHPATLPGESPKSSLPSAGPKSLPSGEGAKSTLPTPAAKASSKPK